MGSPAGATTTTSNAKETPEIGASPDVLRAFLDSRIPYQSVPRTRMCAIWNKATRYREVHQWIEPSFNRDINSTSNWSDIEFKAGDDDAVPTPVQPEIFVHLSNEAARLGKPENEPYVRPDGENPDVMARQGAKTAERALQDRLREMDFEEIEAEGDMQMPLWGQSIYESSWETDSTKVTRVPVTTAKCCPNHPMAMKKAGDVPPKPNAPDPDAAQEATEAGPDTDVDQTAPPAMGTPQDTGEDLVAGMPDAMPEEAMEPTPPAATAPPPECDFVTAKPEVDLETANALPPSVLRGRNEPVPGQQGVTELKTDVTACPQCEDHPPLVDFYPSDQEASNGKDTFGRPLGEDKPIGDWVINLISPHDLFPQSMGIGLQAREWRHWTTVRPRPVQWLATHYANGRFVKAESQQAIMEWHPIGGEREVFESGGAGDSGIFQDFAREKVYHELPSPKFPLGRSIAMAGDQVLLDSTFMVPSQTVPGEYFERVDLELIPWEPRPHQSHGLSMSELMFSLQDDINEERSRDSDVSGRMGTMFWLARRGMDLDTVSLEGGGYSGKVVEFSTDPTAPTTSPQAVGGESIANPMVAKCEFLIEAMGRISGTNDVEGGNPPPGGTFSALAMQFLSEKSGERRATRLRRKRKAMERLYSHGLKLMYHRCLEPRKLRFKDADGQFKERSWRGLEFNGQIRVTIDAESEHDTKLQQQQKLLDAVGKNMYDMTNPAVRDRIQEKLELPRDVDGQMEKQQSNANREWCDFRDLDKEPVVDDSIDDPQAHHEQHGLDIMGDEFRDLEDEAQWDAVYPFICDWKQQFMMLDQQLQMAGVQRPPLLEYRISAAWDALLLQRGIKTATFPPDQLKALRKVTRFRAHFEAHTFKAELEAQMAAMGRPALAAPGAPETQGGSVPTPGSPAVQAPGAGMGPAAPQPQPVM